MDEEQQEKPRSWLRWLKIPAFLLLAAVVGLALLLAMTGTPVTSLLNADWRSLIDRTAAGFQEEAPASAEIRTFDENAALAIETVGDNIVCATVSEIFSLDSEGTQLWKLPVSIRQPWLDAEGQDVLIADIGGRYLGLVRAGQVVWERTLDEDIVNASLSRDYVLLITNSAKDGYNMNVHALSVAGTEVSFRVVSEYYPYLAVTDSDFGQNLFVLSGFAADGLKTTAVVEFMTPKWEQKASVRGEDELFSGAFALDDAHLALVGEKRLICYDSQLKAAWTHQPEGCTLAGAVGLDSHRVLCADFEETLYENQRVERTTFAVLDSDGEERGSVTSDGRVRRLATNGSIIAAATDSQLIFLDDGPQILKTQSMHGTVTDLKMTDNGLVYAVCGDVLSVFRPVRAHRFLGIF